MPYYPQTYFAESYFPPRYFPGPSGAFTAPIMPSPRRTLKPLNPGYAGSNFIDIYTIEDDTFGFDVSSFLASGETITSILSFEPVPDDPAGASDSNPTNRILGGAPLIVGTIICQRLGNWLNNYSTFRYRVSATFSTSFNDQLAIFSYVNVLEEP